MSSAPGYNDFVFINCPFDTEYANLLQAIIYTVYRCGFYPQTALGEDDASDYRLDKIVRYIKNCRYGIHDISRIQLNDEGFPRFNMPFELGIFYGAKRFGSKEQKIKNTLVFEEKKYSYQKYISDLNGVDTKAHNNDVNTIIRNVRDWLKTSSKRATIPGHTIIQKEYKEFQTKIPAIVKAAGLDEKDIPFNDFCSIVEQAIAESHS